MTEYEHKFDNPLDGFEENELCRVYNILKEVAINNFLNKKETGENIINLIHNFTYGIPLSKDNSIDDELSCIWGIKTFNKSIKINKDTGKTNSYSEIVLKVEYTDGVEGKINIHSDYLEESKMRELLF